MAATEDEIRRILAQCLLEEKLESGELRPRAVEIRLTCAQGIDAITVQLRSGRPEPGRARPSGSLFWALFRVVNWAVVSLLVFAIILLLAR